MRSRLMLLTAMLGLLTASCVDGELGETAPPDQTGPFHPIPADSVAVAGTAECELSENGVNPDGGAGFLAECRLDMSDPRVTGVETHDRFRFFDGGRPQGELWVVEEATITNAEGTWRGAAQAAEDAFGIPSGEAHYRGEGAYEGLEFHYYFWHANLNDKAELRGWISGGG